MRGISYFIFNWVKSARRFYGQISPRGKLQLAIVVGVIGLLVLGIGIYNTIDVTNKYNDLNAIPEPDADTAKQMSQADLLLVAQVGLAKRDLLARRGGASSVIGVGAIILGLATLVFVNIPEQPKPGSSSAPITPTNSVPGAIKPETTVSPEKPPQE